MAADVMPDEAVAALAALDLAMADTPSAYVARRVAELRLVASMARSARSSGRDRDPMSNAGLVLASSDRAADAGIVTPPAVALGSHGVIGVPAAPVPAMAVPLGSRTAARPVEARPRVAVMHASPRPPPGHPPDETVDAARVVPFGGRKTSSAPPVDADPLPPAAAAALAALDRANDDTPQAALARRIDEARLRASFVRSRRRSSDRGRPETKAGRIVAAAGAVANASPSSKVDLPSMRTPAPPGLSADPACLPDRSLPRSEVQAWPKAVQERSKGRPVIDAERGRPAGLGSSAPFGIAVRADDLQQHGPEPLPQDAVAALLALDLAMADTPAAYVGRRIAEMQLRASIQRRIRPTPSVADRQAPSTPSEAAAGEPPPSRGIDRLPHAISDDPTSPMPSIDDVPRFEHDGSDVGDAPAMSDVERRRSWTSDLARSIVISDPGAVLSRHDDAGSAVPQPTSMTETDPVGPGTADQSLSDLAGLYHALGEERRAGRGDGTGRRAVTPSARHGVIEGIETPVTSPPHLGAESSIASPVLPPSTGADASSLSQAVARIAAPVLTRSPSSTDRRPAPGEVGMSPADAPAGRPSTPGPAHQAMTLSPSDQPVPILAPGLPVDGIEFDLMDIDDIEDIEDVLAAIDGVAVPPKEPATPAFQAKISSPAPGADVGHSAIASGDRRAVPSAMGGGSDPVFHGSSRSAFLVVRQAASAAPVQTSIAEAASKGEAAARAGASPGPAPSPDAGSPSFQYPAPKLQLSQPPAAPSASSWRGMSRVAPLSPPVALAGVETIPSPPAPVPDVGPAGDDPADWSDIELGEPEDIEDMLVGPETPSPDVAMPSPGAPPASRSPVQTVYDSLRHGVSKGLQWLNGGPPDPAMPGDDPASLPVAGSLMPPSPMPIAGLEQSSTAPATSVASMGRGSPAAVLNAPSGVDRPEASPALPRPVPTLVRPNAALAPAKHGMTVPSGTSTGLRAAPPPPQSGFWNPGLIPGELRALAGLYTRYMMEHDGDRSRAARTASIRVVLGPDADRLERFVRRHIGPAQAGDDQARLVLHRLTRRADPLRRASDKETTKSENAEIRKHGGSPVPVRPPHDPREGSRAERFLTAAFLTGRATGNVGLEQAAALAHAKRRDGELAWSRHVMECLSVWAGDEPSAAEAFRLAQPGQDRLSGSLAVPKAGWLPVLAKVYRDAFGVPLLDGGRGGVGGLAD